MASIKINGNEFDPSNPGDAKVVECSNTSWVLIQIDAPLDMSTTAKIEGDTVGRIVNRIHDEQGSDTWLMFCPAEDKVEKLESCSAIKNFFAYHPHFKCEARLKKGQYYRDEDEIALHVETHRMPCGDGVEHSSEDIRTVKDRLAKIFDISINDDEQTQSTMISGFLQFIVRKGRVQELIEVVANWEEVQQIGEVPPYVWY